MNKRIEFFDTTKGLLMFFLVWGHMIIFAKALGIYSNFTQVIQNTVPFYRAFFMQSFFIITGFCTSWSIPFKDFVVKNFKTIILPAFIFLPFAYLTKIIKGSECGFAVFCNLVVKYLVEGGPWFLAALFIAKLLYWIIKNYCKNKWLECVMVVCCFVVGLVVKESTSIPNNWSYQHAFVMLPFLFLGSKIKVWNIEGINWNFIKICGGGNLLSNKYLMMVSLPYFAIIILWQILGLRLGFPAVDAYINIHYITAPFHIAFAVSGTALVFLLAKALQNIDFIKVIGRQSLFVYLIHSLVVFALMKLSMILEIPTVSYMQGAIFYFSIYIISFVIIYFGCRLMEYKYFRWMVGKF